MVETETSAALVSTNYMVGATKTPALVMKLPPKNGPFTVLGNVTSGEIQINGSPLAAPWAPLNVVIS